MLKHFNTTIGRLTNRKTVLVCVALLYETSLKRQRNRVKKEKGNGNKQRRCRCEWPEGSCRGTCPNPSQSRQAWCPWGSPPQGCGRDRHRAHGNRLHRWSSTTHQRWPLGSPESSCKQVLSPPPKQGHTKASKKRSFLLFFLLKKSFFQKMLYLLSITLVNSHCFFSFSRVPHV